MFEGCVWSVCVRLTAVGLVGPILAVVLLVAGPAHGNAAAAWTGEEVGWTLLLLLVCGEQEYHSTLTLITVMLQGCLRR